MPIRHTISRVCEVWSSFESLLGWAAGFTFLLYLVKFIFSSEHPTSQGTVSVEGYTIKPKHITLKNKEAIGWISNPYIWPR